MPEGKKKPITKKSVLGRGLGALLPDQSSNENSSNNDVSEANLVNSISEIEISTIETNPYQPRSTFDELALDELKNSIEQHGVIQPITVRKLNDFEFQLIAGERRLLASKKLGLTKIPAFIRLADDEQMLEFALIENIQRQDLNPLEIAIGYQRLIDECKLIIEEVGTKVGKNRSTVNNYLRLLKLPSEIQAGLRSNLLSMGHARALITIEDEETQRQIYNQIFEKNLSVRQVEDLVRKLPQNNKKEIESKSKPETNRSTRTILINNLQSELSNFFDTKVKINSSEEGKGEIKISFYSDEEFNRILDLLKNQ